MHYIASNCFVWVHCGDASRTRIGYLNSGNHTKTKNTILYTTIGAIDSMVHLEMQMPIDSVTHTEDHAILFMDETLKIE